MYKGKHGDLKIQIIFEVVISKTAFPQQNHMENKKISYMYLQTIFEGLQRRKIIAEGQFFYI